MFNKKEEKGVIIFIVIIVIMVMVKNYNQSYTSNTKLYASYNSRQSCKKIETIPLDSFLMSTQTVQNDKEKYSTSKNKVTHSVQKTTFKSKNIIKFKPFNFNPNKISKDSLLKLGLSHKVANNWTKYIDKGGRFHSKKDIKKIYGLSEESYNKIQDFIVINDKNKGIRKNLDIGKTISIETNKHKFANKYKIHKQNLHIEINTCTAEDLIKLRGIGEVLSKRIVKFRNKLGGFVSVDQLKEVYGLPEETYNNIKADIYINIDKVKKLRINTEDSKTLKSFPYISYRLASQIIKFRKQHGYFSNKYDLLKIKSLDSLELRKIEPYLDYARN